MKKQYPIALPGIALTFCVALGLSAQATAGISKRIVSFDIVSVPASLDGVKENQAVDRRVEFALIGIGNPNKLHVGSVNRARERGEMKPTAGAGATGHTTGHSAEDPIRKPSDQSSGKNIGSVTRVSNLQQSHAVIGSFQE